MTAPFRLYNSLEEAQGLFGPAAVTIGNFDGVHLAHQALLGRVRALGGERGVKPSVLTFDPHPTFLVAPAKAPPLLTTMEQRTARMQSAAIEQIMVLPFTHDVCRLPPEAFAREILAQALGARAVVVGDNFRFGHKAAGDVADLRRFGGDLGFVVDVVPAVQWRGLTVSSSEVRRLLRQGDVSRAGRLLGRCYALEGEVVPGFGIGSRQTVPTLNLRTAAEVLPAHGVYVTRTADREDGRRWPSITNIGVRPTFNGNAVTIETFLLAPLDGEPPRHIEVEFLRWVRAERRFDTPAELKAQILRDVARAQAYERRTWRRASGLSSV